jgi:alkanesulfonate monooxygenase
VPGGIQHDFERVGEVSSHETRYERAEEFIDACRKLWQHSGPVTYKGEFYRLEDAYCAPEPGKNSPLFYLGGVSPRAMAMSGRQADVHLSWIEPLEDTKGRLDGLRKQYEESKRTPVFGLRTHLVVRDTEEEAWAAANELIDHADPDVKAQRRSAIEGTQMVGARAQAQEAPDHRLGRHLWNGLSEVRVNCGSAIVGTPEQVADELLPYWELGMDEFILSGFPHVEECHRVADQVLPLLRERIAAA